jgi:hypothetical protein
MAPRRSYGSGRVYVRRDSAGRETFYGTWWANGRWVNRRLGVKRPRGSREGLTGAQAEAELRRLMGEAKPSVAQGERPATAYRAEGLGDHAHARKLACPSFAAWLQVAAFTGLRPGGRDRGRGRPLVGETDRRCLHGAPASRPCGTARQPLNAPTTSRTAAGRSNQPPPARARLGHRGLLGRRRAAGRSIPARRGRSCGRGRRRPRGRGGRRVRR